MTIQIACCIDNNFVMQYSVLMASLKTSNPHQEFHIHLLGNGLNDVSKESVGNISKSLDLPVTVYDVNIQEFSINQLIFFIHLVFQIIQKIFFLWMMKFSIKY